MFTCDTGGVLNRVLHFYHYVDLEARDVVRRGAASNAEWRDEYIPHTRQFVSQQESSIYLPAVSVLQSAKAIPIQEAAKLSKHSGDGPPALYELRQYQLHPGYGSVPKLMEAFEKG